MTPGLWVAFVVIGAVTYLTRALPLRVELAGRLQASPVHHH